MKSRSIQGDQVFEDIIANHSLRDGILCHGKFIVEIIRDGEVIEEFETPNLVTTEGLNYFRDAGLLGGTQIDPWYIALIDGSPTIAAGDNYETQAGWAEVTAYDEATREEWVGVSGATGVATNAAARAEFTISAGGATIGGVALVGGGTDADTKGNTAGGGTLFSASAFSGGDRALNVSDVLRITYQHTNSNA